MENFVITVERGFGSGGKTIAYEVAERLGVPCYEGEIIKMASDWSGISLELFGKMNEAHRNRSVSKYADSLGKGLIALPGHRFAGTIRDETLFLYQAEIIKGIANTENCVIVGYAANYILKKFPNVLAVNIQAPAHICVQEIADRYVMGINEAADLVARTDQQRAGFYKYFTGKDWTSYKDYDVILNSHRLGRENTVSEIIALMKGKMENL